jgi:hypothetical protein
VITIDTQAPQSHHADNGDCRDQHEQRGANDQRTSSRQQKRPDAADAGRNRPSPTAPRPQRNTGRAPHDIAAISHRHTFLETIRWSCGLPGLPGLPGLTRMRPSARDGQRILRSSQVSGKQLPGGGAGGMAWADEHLAEAEADAARPAHDARSPGSVLRYRGQP